MNRNWNTDKNIICTVLLGIIFGFSCNLDHKQPSR